jgi:hypothetical protein
MYFWIPREIYYLLKERAFKHIPRLNEMSIVRIVALV